MIDGESRPDAMRKADGEPIEAVGRYRIIRRLGEGGMGSVYLAEDTILRRQVALKLPLTGTEKDPEVRERFLREARSAATLDHPYICRVYDAGEVDGRLYLAMAYIEGQSLADLVRAEGMPARQVVALIGKLAIALNEAHLKGVVHRDLKPRNVMIRIAGSKKEPVIVDFGLARLTNAEDDRMTKTGQVLGTPAYMAPEQLLGKTDEIGPTSDIYALGVILYELLTGQLPFEGSYPVLVAKILTQSPLPPSTRRPGLDLALDVICLKSMAKESSRRYASMMDLASSLTEYLRVAPSASISRRPIAPIRRPVEPDSIPIGADTLVSQLFGRETTEAEPLIMKFESRRSQIEPMPESSPLPSPSQTKNNRLTLRFISGDIPARFFVYGFVVLLITFFIVLCFQIQSDRPKVKSPFDVVNNANSQTQIDFVPQGPTPKRPKPSNKSVGQPKLEVAPITRSLAEQEKRPDQPPSPRQVDPLMIDTLGMNVEFRPILTANDQSRWIAGDKDFVQITDRGVRVSSGMNGNFLMSKRSDYSKTNAKLVFVAKQGTDAYIAVRCLPDGKGGWTAATSRIFEMNGWILVGKQSAGFSSFERHGSYISLEPGKPITVELKIENKVLEVWVNGNLNTRVGGKGCGENGSVGLFVRSGSIDVGEFIIDK